jgi:cytochrome c
MKAMVGVVCGLALAGIAAADSADDYGRGFALAMRKGCFECHAIGRREVGPSFVAIAEQYRFDLEGRERLPLVVRGGSAGHWGERFVMWPQTQLTSEEAKQLVDWVLAQ